MAAIAGSGGSSHTRKPSGGGGGGSGAGIVGSIVGGVVHSPISHVVGVVGNTVGSVVSGSTAASSPTVPTAQQNAAIRYQQQILRKYVFHQEKQQLVNAHIDFAHGLATGPKVQARQIGEDLHAAAGRIRNASPRAVLGPDVAHQVHHLNKRGYVVPGKVIHQTVTQQNVSAAETLAYIGDLNKSAHKLVHSLPKEADSGGGVGGFLVNIAPGPVKPEVSKAVGVAEDVAHLKLPTFGYDPTQGETDPLRRPEAVTLGQAALALAPIPGLKGVEALRAIKAGGEGALLSRGVAAGARAIAPTATEKAVEIGAKLGERSAILERLGAGAKYKPLTTTFKSSIPLGAALHPEATIHTAAQVVAHPGEDLQTATDFVKRSPAILAHTLSAATDPNVLKETGYGLISSAFYAPVFPIQFAIESVKHGPGEATSATLGGFGQQIGHVLGPAIRGDYAEYQRRLAEPGGGGLLIPLTVFAPYLAGVSRGAGEALRATVPALAEDRPLYRYGVGEEQVRQLGTSRSLSRLGQKVVDTLAARRIHPDLGVKEGERGPLVARGPVSRMRSMDVARVVSRQIPGEAMRAKETVAPLSKLLLKHQGDGAFSYAIDLGFPKDARSLIDALRAHAEQIPHDSPEAVAIPDLIRQIEEKGLPKKFADDVIQAQTLMDNLGRQLPKLTGDTRTIARYKGQAEHLAKRGKLPTPQEVLGETPKAQAKAEHTGARIRERQANSEYRIAESGVRQARLTLERRRAKGASPKAIKLAEDRLAAAKTRLAEAKTLVTAARNARKSAATAAKKATVKGRRDQLNRNFADDAEAYVREVGPGRIDVAARRAGLGAPGYHVATEELVSKSHRQERIGKRSVGEVKRSRGELARAGRRLMVPEAQLEQAHRVTKAISMVRAQGDLKGLTRKIHDVVPEGTKIADTSLTTLVGTLRRQGIDVDQFAFINMKAIERRTGVAARTEKAKPGEELAAGGELPSAVERLFEQAAVAGKDVGQIPEALAKETGWKLIGPTELAAWQANIRMASGLGPFAKALAKIKTVGSRGLLLHPAWLASQFYAVPFTAALAEPRYMATRGYKDFIDGMTSEEQQRWMGRVGVSAHIDYSKPNEITLPSIVGTGQRLAKWRLLKRGSDTVFRTDVGQTRFHTQRVMFTKVKREAVNRMLQKAGHSANALNRALYGTGKNLATDKGLAEAIKEVTNDNVTMERFWRDTRSFMGDYANFTPAERKYLANNVLFYGFMRHSVMLSLWTLPVKHPIRASILLQMGKLTETQQKQAIQQATQEQLESYYKSLGMAPKEAKAAAAHYRLPGGQIPFQFWGNLVMPDGNVVGLARSSFIGSGPFTALGSGVHNAFQLLAAANPALSIPLSGLLGYNLFTGGPIRTTSDPGTPGKLQTVALGDWPKFLASQAAGYFAPLRVASQMVSKYPSAERTSTSFPLPFLPHGGPFPEVPFQYSSRARKQQQRFASKQVYQKNITPKSILQSESFVIPHPTLAIPQNAYYYMLDLVNKASSLPDKKKSSTGGGMFAPTDFGGSSFKPLSFGGSSDQKSHAPTLSNSFAYEVTSALHQLFKVTGPKAKELQNFASVDRPKPGPAGPPPRGGTKAGNPNAKQRPGPAPKASKRFSASNISGVTPTQAQFSAAVANHTGLSPRVIAAWVKEEGGNPSGDYNYMNIGWTDSGPNSLTQSGAFQSPQSAGKQTAAFIRGDWGGASSGIQAIASTAGKSDQEQLAAIANSGWATDPAYASKLQATYAAVAGPGSVKSKPPPLKTLNKYLNPTPSVHFKGESPILLDRLVALAKGTGQTLTVTSGYRSVKKQAMLYNQMLAGQRAGPVAKPGTSMHNFGLAADVTVGGVPIQNAIPASTLAKYDLATPVAGDPVHVQLAGAAGEQAAAEQGYTGSAPVASAGTGTYSTPSGTSSGAVASYGAPAAQGAPQPQPQGKAPTPPLKLLSLIQGMSKPGGTLRLAGIPAALTKQFEKDPMSLTQQELADIAAAYRKARAKLGQGSPLYTR